MLYFLAINLHINVHQKRGDHLATIYIMALQASKSNPIFSVTVDYSLDVVEQLL